MGSCCSRVSNVDKRRANTDDQTHMVSPLMSPTISDDGKQVLVEDAQGGRSRSTSPPPPPADLPPSPRKTPIDRDLPSPPTPRKSSNPDKPRKSSSPDKPAVSSLPSDIKIDVSPASLGDAKASPAGRNSLEDPTSSNIPSSPPLSQKSSSHTKKTSLFGGIFPFPAPVAEESPEPHALEVPPSVGTEEATPAASGNLNLESPVPSPNSSVSPKRRVERSPGASGNESKVDDTLPPRSPGLGNHLSLASAEEQRKQMLTWMVNGQFVRKRNKFGIMQRKFLWIDKTHTMLHWGKDPANKTAKKAGSLLGSIEEVKAENEKGFRVVTDKRDFYFDSDSTDARDKWVEGLNSASADRKGARRQSFSQSYVTEDEDE
eukprot:TRINITY_DN29201_c0_g1_i1.p1 TRINITY_DN29201_c0_g1~~TRINITY_DN29201_c0_g1_i1.p1  ORF type:complete len:374 (-),score=97.64 TRINITY_DN29201_c0_g1_i1:129-1250(-)